MNLTALIERIEKLRGPDREVDAEIARACGIAWSSDEYGQFGGYGIMPARVRFTASVDAALTLVPPHHLWEVRQGIEARAVVWQVMVDYEDHPGLK